VPIVVAVADTLVALPTLLKERIRALMWLVGIDMMVVHIEDNCRVLEERTEVWIRIQERVAARVGKRLVVLRQESFQFGLGEAMVTGDAEMYMEVDLRNEFVRLVWVVHDLAEVVVDSCMDSVEVPVRRKGGVDLLNGVVLLGDVVPLDDVVLKGRK
jgi:hypothetical protein